MSLNLSVAWFSLFWLALLFNVLYWIFSLSVYIYHLIHIIKHYDLIINCLTGHNYSVLRPLDILNVKNDNNQY